MTLFLIRHAHAVDADEDTERPLSKKGRKQVRRLAKFLRASGQLEAREWWHSPLARSHETAALLAKQLRANARLVEVHRLEGNDDPAILARRLANREQSLVIVGHEPHLGSLASLLVCGDSGSKRFVLGKCAVVALERADKGWAVRWQIAPELLE